MYPAPGNHDHVSTLASNYCRYFFDNVEPHEDCNGTFEGDNDPWYREIIQGPTGSTDAKIMVVSLDTETSISSQSNFLDNTMSDGEDSGPPGQPTGGVPNETNSDCDVLFFHRPAWTSSQESGTWHGEDANARTWYDKFDLGGGDLVLVGHNHAYERFRHQTIAGTASSNSPRQILVGTGGNAGIYDGLESPDDDTPCFNCKGDRTGSQVLIDEEELQTQNRHGVLVLEFTAVENGYDTYEGWWYYVKDNGSIDPVEKDHFGPVTCNDDNMAT